MLSDRYDRPFLSHVVEFGAPLRGNIYNYIEVFPHYSVTIICLILEKSYQDVKSVINRKLKMQNTISSSSFPEEK